MMARFRLAAAAGIAITARDECSGAMPKNYPRIWRILLRSRYLAGRATAFRYY